MPVIKEDFNEASVEIDESKEADKIYNSCLESNKKISNRLSIDKNLCMEENISKKGTVKACDYNLSEKIIIPKPPMVNLERCSLDKIEKISVDGNILHTEKIKPKSEVDTHEVMSQIPLKVDVDQNKSVNSDMELENGNETATASSQVNVIFSYFY